MSGYNYEAFGQCEVNAPDFRAVAKVGGPAPDFTIPDLDGNPVALSSFKGRRYVLLEFGSIT